MTKKKVETTEEEQISVEEPMESGDSHAALGVADVGCCGAPGEPGVVMVQQEGREPELVGRSVVLRAQSGGTVYAESGRLFATGVSVTIPEGYVAVLASDPIMCRDKGCVCSGVILPGEGEKITVKLYNRGRGDHDVQQGDAIGRLVIVPVLPLA